MLGDFTLHLTLYGDQEAVLWSRRVEEFIDLNRAVLGVSPNGASGPPQGDPFEKRPQVELCKTIHKNEETLVLGDFWDPQKIV